MDDEPSGHLFGTPRAAEAAAALARGDIEAARSAVALCDPDARRADRTLMLVEADLAVRTRTATLFGLEQVRSACDTVHAAWADALISEYLFWQSDPAAFLHALDALAGVTDDALAPAPVLVGRGRLKRIVAVAQLFSGNPDGPQQGWRLVSEAVNDLTRAGWEEERAVAVALFSTLWTSISWDDVERSCAALEEATQRLRRLRSPYLSLALVGRAVVNFVAGDMHATHLSLDEADAVDGAGPGVVDVGVFTDFLRSLARMLGTWSGAAGHGGTSEAEFRRQADAFLLAAPERGAGSIAVVLGMVMADLGDMSAAESWLDRSLDQQSFTPYGYLDRDALRARIAVSRADIAAVDTIRQICDTYKRSGFARWAGILYARTALDARRAGLTELSANLHLEAEANLVDPPARTLWEILLTTPGDQAVAPAADRSRSILRLLAPAATVLDPDGTSRAVAASVARLLVVLATARRRMGVEEVIDRLWPDNDPAGGRNRLNQAVHRARRALGLGPDEFLVRSDEGVELVAHPAWRVDVWEFTDAVAGNLTARRAAFELYEADLCATQLAYDEAVLDARRRLHTAYCDLATNLIASNGADAAAVAARIERVGVDDPALVDAAAAALRLQGRGSLPSA